jgi:hypothetical protein
MEDALMSRGSQCEHILFLTPNDDEHFMIFTADNYTGPVEGFFEKLRAMRAGEMPRQDVRQYDKRKYMPYKGNIRQEDLVTQATQGTLGRRRERLGASDRGVIKLRKIVVEAIETAIAGGIPKGVVTRERAREIVKLDTAVGVRAKTAAQ